MKVIHLISGGDTGGAKTHIHYLLSGLSRSIDATLVCFMRGEFSDEAEALGIPTVILDGNMFSVIRKLKEMISAGGYDLIHSHGARGNFIASLIRRPCRLPVITTVHSDPKLDYLGRPMAGLVYGTLNSFALRRADYLVGVSHSMKNLLIERGFAPNSIFTIYNGVDFSVEPHCSDRLSYLRSLGLDCDENCVVVGIAARLDPVKDVATLIRGFAHAEKRCEKLRLVIAGDGQQLEELKALSAELGVSEKVCFAGWINGMSSFFGSIDINTLSSLSETFPYSVTEGARAKLPTVSSRVGGVPMLISDGETGFLFSPGDWETLGERLLELARDESMRKRLGKAIYDKARRDFSVEATTQTQISIYSEVLRLESIKARGARNGVVICGAYGMGNAGDDAILEAIIGEVSEISPTLPITALSRNPKETRLKYGVNSVHMFDVLAFRSVMRGTSLYISGGGSLIQNVTSRRSLWYYLHTIKTAKAFGNDVMMYGCGIGPIVDTRDEPKVRDTLNRCVDIITLREPYSLSELKRIGVTKPQMLVSSDPALTLPPAARDVVDMQLKSCGLEPEGGYVCFSVRSWTGFEAKASEFAQAADYVAQSLGLTPVFILINHREDGEATDLVRGLMKSSASVISGALTPSLTIGILSRMRAVVSMRLHALIFSASQGVPLVGVSYDPKVTAFLDSVGEERCIPFESLSAETLKVMISKAVQEYDDAELRRACIEKLICAESINSSMARQLLDKQGIL